MRGLHYIAFHCLLLLAALPGVTQAAESKPDAPLAPGAGRDKALLAFERDLVSVLAPQVDPTPLLGAALLARPLKAQPKVNTFHVLIERAAYAEGADAGVQWVRLADCDAAADTCPNAAALGKLVAQAPDNAAVWLFKLSSDMHNLKAADARADLAKAAAAKAYDDYTGATLKALATSVGILPPPPETMNDGNAAAVDVVLVYGLAKAQPQPALPPTAELCEKSQTDASIKADCLKLGHTLEWGSSPLSRSLGLHLREVLADDPTQQADAKRARLSLIWQVRSFSQLLVRAQTDPVLASHMLTLARRGGTEMSLMLAAMRDNGIPADAPHGWEPPRPAP